MAKSVSRKAGGVKSEPKSKTMSKKIFLNANPGKDATAVWEYMNALNHPLKKEVEGVRKIIKMVNSDIGERIKWNAPSYYFRNQDLVTFNLRAKAHVHLVFHHPAIVKIKSSILEGDYRDRRMTYFKNMVK